MNNQIIFIKKFISSPVTIGALAPSSPFLAKKICQVIDMLDDIHILELGPGTGSITKAIAHKNPKLVELDTELAHLLKQKFPHLEIVNNCAIQEINKINQPTGIVISIPLINNPIKDRFVEAINKKRDDKLIKWCVIFTYGFHNPLAETHFRHHERKKHCMINIPPASVWMYRD